MAFYPENTTQQNEQFHKNVTAQNHVNCDPFETYSHNLWRVIKQLDHLKSCGMLVIWSLEVFIKMMSDFLSNPEDISAHVIHYVCCHTPFVLI